MTKLLPRIVLWCALACCAASANAQPWANPAAEEFGSRAYRPDLDLLSTDELIALYAAEYESTLRSRTASDAFLAPRSHLTLQVGYSFAYDEDDLDYQYTTHAFPRLLLRYRANDWLELRGGWSGVTLDTITDRMTGDRDRESLAADPSVGVRISLTDQRGMLPRTALTLSTPVEVSQTASLANRFDPLATLAYAWCGSESLLVCGSTGVAWVTDGVDRAFDFRQSASVDYALSDRLDVYGEWFCVLANGVEFRHFAGPGVSYRLSRRLEAGCSTSFGLDEASTDLLAEFNITYRF